LTTFRAFSFTELDTIGTDTLITRMTDDINQVQNGINMGLRLLLRSQDKSSGADPKSDFKIQFPMVVQECITAEL